MKAFSKFHHRHSELIVEYNAGLKTSATRHIRASIFWWFILKIFRSVFFCLVIKSHAPQTCPFFTMFKRFIFFIRTSVQPILALKTSREGAMMSTAGNLADTSRRIHLRWTGNQNRYGCRTNSQNLTSSSVVALPPHILFLHTIL